MADSIQHLAVIMDGNGRWAQAKGLPRVAGHKEGLESVRSAIRSCQQYDIKHLTLFAFSSENWRRPKAEVSFLMELFVTAIKKELKELKERNVILRFVGDTSAFSNKLQRLIQEAEFQTAENTGLNVNVAVNYGGRWDIAQAARSIAGQVKAGELQLDDIDAELFAQHVCLSDIPEPDLLIRTSGELRISNFLIWQLAYSELYFTDCLWPDFRADEMTAAIEWFAGRKRRFGCTAEQMLDGMDQFSA